jgi:hypothetical protein
MSQQGERLQQTTEETKQQKRKSPQAAGAGGL